MSEETVRLGLRFAESFSRREVDEDILTPDFILTNVDTAVTSREYRGADGIREWFEDFFGVLGDDARTEAEVCADGDDWVLAKLRIIGSGLASGAPLDLSYWGVAWVRDGRIARAIGYATRREALAAVETGSPPG